MEQLRHRCVEIPESEMDANAMPDTCVPCARCPTWILREKEHDLDREKCRYMTCPTCRYEFCWDCLGASNDHMHVPRGTQCEPDKREARLRKLRTKTDAIQEVPVWPGCTACDVCDAWPLPGSAKVWTCLNCPNSYVCNDCYDRGQLPCPPEHVFTLLTRSDGRNSSSQPAIDIGDTGGGSPLEVPDTVWESVGLSEDAEDASQNSPRSTRESMGNTTRSSVDSRQRQSTRDDLLGLIGKAVRGSS